MLRNLKLLNIPKSMIPLAFILLIPTCPLFSGSSCFLPAYSCLQPLSDRFRDEFSEWRSAVNRRTSGCSPLYPLLGHNNAIIVKCLYCLNYGLLLWTIMLRIHLISAYSWPSSLLFAYNSYLVPNVKRNLYLRKELEVHSVFHAGQPSM